MTSPLQLAGVAFAAGLAEHGEQVALLEDGQRTTYHQLAERVANAAARLGPERRLVLLEAAPEVAVVSAYLACLAAGHPVLVSEPQSMATLRDTYDPDVIISAGGWFEQREGTAHELHPDLALLLSTSGSTGSPKLVRLSRTAVQSNAQAITEAVGTRPTDVAAMVLPLHYCYGLSVLHSHLLAGAATLLTRLSVVDPCFWELARTAGVTTLPGVPHTFSLLDRVGFEHLELPSLRLLTQAGGRLAPEQVRRYAQLGQRRGFDLTVMYGQTEATARMSVLPPDLATTHPASVGKAVPGGDFRLDPVKEGDELVYTGPNVMLGYASCPQDLALGRVVTELRTGDLARLSPEGLVEVVGRRSRFLKVLGKRVDVDRLEAILRQAGYVVGCDGSDERVVVAVEGISRRRLAEVRSAVGEATGLPAAAVQVYPVDVLPVTASGKLDGAAVRRLATPTAQGRAPRSVREVFALVLEREDVGDDDTFVRLGGDSLSYVEASLRLEELLGDLPPAWHLTPVRELGARKVVPAAPTRAVETGIVLRALAVVLVVANHTEVLGLVGGAHLLLGLAGFNAARFLLVGAGRRAGEVLRVCGRIAAPTVLAVAVTGALTGWYSWQHLLLVQDLVDPGGPYHHYWFVEVLLQLILLSTLVLAVPWIGRLNAARPMVVPLVLLGLGILLRYGVLPAGEGPARIYAPAAVAWLFAWGWAASRASHAAHRWALSAVLVVATHGFFPGHPGREMLVASGLLLVLWRPTLRMPRRVVPLIGVLAGASLYVYVSHYWVMSSFHTPWLAFALSFPVGVAYQRALAAGTWAGLFSRLTRLLHRRRSPGPLVATAS